MLSPCKPQEQLAAPTRIPSSGRRTVHGPDWLLKWQLVKGTSCQILTLAHTLYPSRTRGTFHGIPL